MTSNLPQPKGAFPWREASGILVAVFFLAGLLVLEARVLAFSLNFYLSYLLLGFIILAISLEPPAPAWRRPFSYGEGLLLFAIIMSIRLPSYASMGMLLEKVPTILLVLLWSFYLRGWKAGDLGLSLRKFWKQVLQGAGFALLYWLLYHATIGLYTAFDRGISSLGFEFIPDVSVYSLFSHPLLSAFFLFLFSNFAEELYFRGFLLKEAHAARGCRFWRLLLFQSLLFGFYHINYGLFPQNGGGADLPFLFWYLAWTGLFGVAFGFAFLVTRSLVANAIFHVLANMMQSFWIVVFIPTELRGQTPFEYRDTILLTALLINAVLFALISWAIWYLKESGSRAEGSSSYRKKISTPWQ